MKRWRKWAQRFAEATRLSLIGITLAAVLLGALSATGQVTLIRLAGLLCIGALVHVAAYLFNDVADRKVDRTDPRRAGFPMVTGALPVLVACTVGTLSVVLSVLADIVLFGPSPGRMTALYLAHAGLLGYDFAGKRCRWPVLTDAVEGIGSAAVVLYGATAVGSPTRATWLVAGYAVAYLMLVTGLHGGVRDVENDRRHGARTLAVLTGVRQGTAGVTIPAPLRRYAMALQLLLVGIAAMPLLWVPQFFKPTLSSLVAGLLALSTAIAAAVVLARALRPGQSTVRLRHLGAAHIVIGYQPAVAMAAMHRGLGWILGGVALCTVPLMANPWFRRGLLLTVTRYPSPEETSVR